MSPPAPLLLVFLEHLKASTKPGLTLLIDVPPVVGGNSSMPLQSKKQPCCGSKRGGLRTPLASSFSRSSNKTVQFKCSHEAKLSGIQLGLSTEQE